jgi:hypothetical protein
MAVTPLDAYIVDFFRSLLGGSKHLPEQGFPFAIVLLLVLLCGFLYFIAFITHVYLAIEGPLTDPERQSLRSYFSELTEESDDCLSLLCSIYDLWCANNQTVEGSPV